MASGAVDYVAEGRSRQIVGKAVLLASGAMERPFPIPGWTLPGVMGPARRRSMWPAAAARSSAQRPRLSRDG